MQEAQRIAESTLRNAEQQLKRGKRQVQQARERSARRSSNAARNVKDAGPAEDHRRCHEAQGAGVRRAHRRVNAARVDDARSRLDDAERALRDDPSIALDLPDTEVPAGRNVFVDSGLRITRGGRALFGDGIDISIRGPERIAVTGPNGAGKTTLLRVISGELEPDDGSIQRADGRIAYLSRLDLLHRPA